MKQFLFAIFTLVMVLSLSTGTYAQEKQDTPKQETKKEIQKEITKSGDQVVDDATPVNSVCPVSGEEADQNITYAYNGKTYALCCNKCLKKFKADPEKYISRMKQDEQPSEKPMSDKKK